MSDDDRSWDRSIQRAQVNMRDPEIKRFYAEARVGEGEGGFLVLLDGRVARTPAKAKLVAPARALAEAIAAEWAAQGETIRPETMPLTRLANSALDGVAQNRSETAAEIAKYAGADLTCYRATEPTKLAERQAAAFDPVLAWAQTALGARFQLAGGIIHVPQPPASLAAVEEKVGNYADPFALAALHGLTSLSGSVLIALAVADGAISADEGWRAAHVDEDFQIEQWGGDAEAEARREARYREFTACARVLDAMAGR